MKDHLSQQQLEDYRQQRLQATELIGVDDHLAVCADCRQRVEVTLPGAAASLYADLRIEAASLPDAGDTVRHLTSDQIAYYLDELVAGTRQQFVVDHLASCAQCAQEADDLHAFKDELTSQPSRVLAAAERANKTSWWGKLRTRFWLPSPAPAFSFALAALLVIILAGSLLRLAFQKKSVLPQIAGGASPSPSPIFSPTLTPVPPTLETAPLLAQLNDGVGQVTLDQKGRLNGLDDLSAAHQQMVKDALQTGRLARPASLAGLNRLGSPLMGTDEQGNSFSLTAPVGKVILSDRPKFRWARLKEATGYVVELYDERFNLAGKSQELQSDEWTPTQPLARGHVYAWQVKASKDGHVFTAPAPPAPQARFRVLDQEQAGEIARASRAHGSSHLTLGLLYARAGLLDEAEQELRALLKANPNSALVRRLLAQVQALRR